MLKLVGCVTFFWNEIVSLAEATLAYCENISVMYLFANLAIIKTQTCGN